MLNKFQNKIQILKIKEYKFKIQVCNKYAKTEEGLNYYLSLDCSALTCFQ